MVRVSSRSANSGTSTETSDNTLERLARLIGEQTEAASASDETASSQTGSNYVPLKTERRTMTYILAKSDFKIIAYTNGVSLTAFACASLCFSVWLSFYTGWFFTPEPSPELLAVIKAVLWISGGLSIILFLLGVWNLIRRQSHIKQIERETKQVPENG